MLYILYASSNVKILLDSKEIYNICIMPTSYIQFPGNKCYTLIFKYTYTYIYLYLYYVYILLKSFKVKFKLNIILI